MSNEVQSHPDSAGHAARLVFAISAALHSRFGMFDEARFSYERQYAPVNHFRHKDGHYIWRDQTRFDSNYERYSMTLPGFCPELMNIKLPGFLPLQLSVHPQTRQATATIGGNYAKQT
jgi:hypothetical protein